MNRDFRGIWIPKEVWLNKDLSANEKILLAEIDSLGGLSDGCFASNQYLAEFFGLSKDRISKLISGLKNKGYITVELVYKEGTCEVNKRIIKLNPYSYFQLGGQDQLGGIGENNDYITNNYNINKNNKPKSSKKKASKKSYGQYKNVKLSDKELEDLIAEYGKDTIDKYIEIMDMKIEEKGYKYKNFSLAMRNWMKKANVKPLEAKVEKQEGDTKYDEEYFTKLMEETLRGDNKF